MYRDHICIALAGLLLSPLDNVLNAMPRPLGGPDIDTQLCKRLEPESMSRKETSSLRRSKERSRDRSRSPDRVRGSSGYPDTGFARLLHCGCTGLMSHASAIPKGSPAGPGV